MKVHIEYCELKGFNKISYGKTHATELEKYKELKEKYDNLAGDDKRFRPKEWDAEIKDFEQKLAETNKESVNLITSLATAEVIKYNKRDLERQIQNEERQNSKNHEFAKSRNNIDL